MLFGFSFVSCLERVNISIAAELMMPALFLAKMQMGRIFSSFLIGSCRHVGRHQMLT